MGMFVAATQLGSLVQAAETKTGETRAETKAGDKTTAQPLHAIPFQGSVVAVDLAGKTFTLNGKAKERKFKVDDHTEIMADNKPSTFSSIAVGMTVRGQALRHEDGWEAKKVTIGAKEPVPASETKK
ncbi:MAG: hypothetical protein DVB28_001726 [Verrucomicrobia bacterium]|nr:MAG: hypothetical protein DVB28_001726 [Verrucomicrobiota bacterium]